MHSSAFASMTRAARSPGSRSRMSTGQLWTHSRHSGLEAQAASPTVTSMKSAIG